MNEIKLSYIDQLNQLSSRDLPDTQIEEIRTYTLELVKDQIEAKEDLLNALVNKIQTQFAGVGLLAVRSSSSQEDLDNQAGAGLYDSVLDVSATDAAQIKKALTQVWLSLFTKRAVLSRRQLSGSKVPLMAILV